MSKKIETKTKAVVVFSGGQDSTTCLAWALEKYDEVRTITFNYGQKHLIELVQASNIRTIWGVKGDVFKTDILTQLGDSALVTGGDVEQEHSHKKGLPASYVPNRNAFMLTVAHAYAQKVGAEAVVTGVCETDYSGYPDCRLGFIEALELALNRGSESNIKFETPLMKLSKADTFALAEDLGALDIVIDESHTCYNGDRDKTHAWGHGCGECPACKLRAAGWEEFVGRDEVTDA